MTDWVLKSLGRGIRTTSWPARAEEAAGVTPGRPVPAARDKTGTNIGVCPTGALEQEERGVAVDFERCVHCQRCRGEGGMPWQDDFEWADFPGRSRGALPAAFHRSVNVRYLDAGACGGCMGEARLIDAPPYNLHRFGIFITATPRDADVLLVAGPVTEAMRTPLRLTYDAMPEPKRVVAMGVCAINGGVFGQSYACAGGAGEVIPVDVVIPGCPPPPLAIIHGLLLALGRVEPASLESTP
ncbi:MAG: NADH-quinone oxidoreductase subunit NuoB [Arenicellales bacterium]